MHDMVSYSLLIQIWTLILEIPSMASMVRNSQFRSPLSFFKLHTDRETAIMYRLQEVVLEQTSTLLAVMEIGAELDR